MPSFSPFPVKKGMQSPLTSTKRTLPMSKSIERTFQPPIVGIRISQRQKEKTHQQHNQYDNTVFHKVNTKNLLPQI